MGDLQSNPSYSSIQLTEKNYEVFLNFRGIDTRDGFSNYLYEALRAKSVETFMDDHGIPEGDEIGPELLKAIRESKISVVIFSKEYASSKWCLRELVEIMKSGQTVIPVFYKVSASDVGDVEGSFMNGFDELKKKFYNKLGKEKLDAADVEKRKKEFDEEMQKWRQALEHASHVKGWSYEKGSEAELIKDIVDQILRRLSLSPTDSTSSGTWKLVGSRLVLILKGLVSLFFFGFWVYMFWQIKQACRKQQSRSGLDPDIFIC